MVSFVLPVVTVGGCFVVYSSPSANKQCAARIYLLVALIMTMILKPSEGQCAMDRCV